MRLIFKLRYCALLCGLWFFDGKNRVFCRIGSKPFLWRILKPGETAGPRAMHFRKPHLQRQRYLLVALMHCGESQALISLDCQQQAAKVACARTRRGARAFQRRSCSSRYPTTDRLRSCDLFGEVLSCVLQVSIVDIILLQHFSVALRLEISRSSVLAITSTETYVPLLSIRVEAQLADKEEDGSPVFVVVTDMTPLEGAGTTEVLLFGTGLVLVQPASDINCARFAFGNVSNVSTDAWTLKTNHVRGTSFLRITDKTTVFIKLFYTLRLREREMTAVKNTMHIAVCRNISTAHTVCEEEIQLTVVRTGQVLSCSGLGESAVAAATALSHATDTVHGEVGGLTSFVAIALHEHVRSVKAVNMLLVFSLPPAVLHTNITHMGMGTLEFTDEFRAACTATHLCHFRYAQQGNSMHFMTSCDTALQNNARTWLSLALGVVHDAGHVMQLCRLAQWHC
jgi:hypothetical protein